MLNELTKSLECLHNRLVSNYNDNVPFEQYEEDRLTVCNALDLINRQQAEIERLERVNGDLLKIADTRKKANFSLLVENTSLKKKIRTARAEAIKEFANEFEYEILHKEFWNDHPHTSQVWLNGYEQCMRDMRVMLKDKLKEMVGEDK
jgi:hypothetical protein